MTATATADTVVDLAAAERKEAKKPRKSTAKKATKPVAKAPRVRAATEPTTDSSITKGIGRYLRECAESPDPTGISLGALPGFNMKRTTDPDVIMQAAEIVEAKAREAKSYVVELQLRQRVRVLRRAADNFRGQGESSEAFFVKHAKKFAERKGIEYATWREMGVAPAVLKKAGIER